MSHWAEPADQATLRGVIAMPVSHCARLDFADEWRTIESRGDVVGARESGMAQQRGWQ